MKNIGSLIMSRRAALKITREELANGICSTKQLYRIEKNLTCPSSQILISLSIKLSIDISDYYHFLNDPFPYESRLKFNKVIHLCNYQDFNNAFVSLIGFDKSNKGSEISKLFIWLSNLQENAESIHQTITNLRKIVPDDTNYLTYMDIRIMNSIAVYYCYLEDYQHSIFHLQYAFLGCIIHLNRIDYQFLMHIILINFCIVLSICFDYNSLYLISTMVIESKNLNLSFNEKKAFILYQELSLKLI